LESKAITSGISLESAKKRNNFWTYVKKGISFILFGFFFKAQIWPYVKNYVPGIIMKYVPG